MITRRLIEAPDGRGWIFLGLLAAAAILVPCLNLLAPPTSYFHVPTSAVALSLNADPATPMKRSTTPKWTM